MFSQVTVIFSRAKLFLQINHIANSFSSHFTDDFKHSLLNAKAIDIQLSLQLQTEAIRDEVCTYGKAIFRRFQKSLNYDQMVFLHNYFPRINVSGSQSNIFLASRHYRKWNFNCIICRKPIGNPGMYVFNGSSRTMVKKKGFLVKTGLTLSIAKEITVFLKQLLPWPQTLMGLDQNPGDLMQVVVL